MRGPKYENIPWSLAVRVHGIVLTSSFVNYKRFDT